jgi:hypothetical protein
MQPKAKKSRRSRWMRSRATMSEQVSQ